MNVSEMIGEVINMKRKDNVLLLAAVLCISIGLHAATPNDARKDAALAAATAWLAILDSSDYLKAASGLADEVLAEFKWPKKEDNLMAAAGILADKRKGEFGVNPLVTRRLQPDGVKLETSCKCGIRDGVFYTFAYDVKYTWDDRRFHVQRFRDGSDVVYMLLEPDGVWKPAGIVSQYGNYGFR
jgi:hypothetical protein